jgi:hypothetical protein
MTSVVYHFTTTLQLPWIVESGELRPYPKDLVVGVCSYLWATVATTPGVGDRTARAALLSVSLKKAWREDQFRLVRFTLPAKSFLTWREVVRREGWTPEQLAAQTAADCKHYGCEPGYQEQWRCRAVPLPLRDVIKVETLRHAGRWRRIALDPGRFVRTVDPNCMGSRHGRKIRLSIREWAETICGVPIYYCRPSSALLDEDEFAQIAYAARRQAEEEDQDDDWWPQ